MLLQNLGIITSPKYKIITMIKTKVESSTESSNGIDHKKTEKTDSNKTHKSVYIIFISLLLDLLAFTIILPLLPTILERYRNDDSSGLYVRLSSQIRYFQELLGAPDRYSSVLFGGFLGSMFSFLQFIVSPVMGALSDCYGRKPILLISLVSFSVFEFGARSIEIGFKFIGRHFFF